LLLYFKSITNKIDIKKNIIHNLSKYSEKIAVVILLFLMLLTAADVIVRFFFRPITGVIEITQLGLAVIVFASIGYSQVTKEHIRIDFFMDFLPVRWQRLNDVFIYTLMLGLFGVLFKQLLVFGDRMKAINMFTPVLNMPVYPAIYIAAIGVLLFWLVLFTDLIETIIKLVRGDDTDAI